MLVSSLQSAKALPPIFVTLDRIVTDVRPLHIIKAASSMLVTLDGIVTDVKLRQ